MAAVSDIDREKETLRALSFDRFFKRKWKRPGAHKCPGTGPDGEVCGKPISGNKQLCYTHLKIRGLA